MVSNLAERGAILIVDNDVASSVQLQELLEHEGYEVNTTAAGLKAMQMITALQPDLVLLDTHLPDVNPLDLINDLKRDIKSRDIPLVLMADLEDADAHGRLLESGDDLIVKPFETREVLARIERQVTVSKVRMALRESEAKFRSVMESAIDAIISVDSEGHIRSWNNAASMLFGYREEEVLGNLIELIIPLRFRELHQKGIHRVSSGGPSHVIGKTVELAAIRKDGSEFPVELSLATWFLDEKRFYTGIIRDITERKQAEQKFRSVTESAIDAIISADHKGRIISWNDAASRILGYTEDEAIDQQLELIIPAGFREAHRQGMARYTAGGEARVIGRTVELTACTKGGEEIPIELSLSTWTVRDQRYYTGIIRDIGERKRAETALRNSEQALREKTEELERKNRQLENTLNRLNEAQNQLIIQEKMASLGKLSAGMAHELNNPASAAQRGSTQLQVTFSRWQQIQLRMGAEKLGESHMNKLVELDRMVRLRTQRPPELNALARSDREAALEDWLGSRGLEEGWEWVPALASLDYTEEGLEELMTHFAPQQFSLILEWLSTTFAIYSLALEIGLSTNRIVEIVRALKSYTYLDQAPVQSVDVREGLDNTLIILHNKLKNGITVHREYEDGLPAIEAYAGELNQVWTNIIDNAIDAMDGKGTLDVRARSEGSWVVVEIQDNGPGIPEEIQSRLFDPFFTTKAPGEGTGLGLNISRNLVVQKHHGEISVNSHPGRTCFTVRLPIEFTPPDKPRS